MLISQAWTCVIFIGLSQQIPLYLVGSSVTVLLGITQGFSPIICLSVISCSYMVNYLPFYVTFFIVVATFHPLSHMYRVPEVSQSASNLYL